MKTLHQDAPAPSAAAVRLSRLFPLGAPALAALAAAEDAPRHLRARAELATEGKPAGTPKLILHGWAARMRVLPDGRRHLLSFLLPGDLLGLTRRPRPLAPVTVVALTELAWCVAPAADAFPDLAAAYATSRALEEAHLLATIVRLGRLHAVERIADLLLELHERLDLAGLVEGGGFALPLTQEGLADALGLTAVHVNRMVQVMRRAGDLSWTGGRMTLCDPAALARRLGRPPTRVSAGAG